MDETEHYPTPSELLHFARLVIGSIDPVDLRVELEELPTEADRIAQYTNHLDELGVLDALTAQLWETYSEGRVHRTLGDYEDGSYSYPEDD